MTEQLGVAVRFIQHFDLVALTRRDIMFGWPPLRLPLVQPSMTKSSRKRHGNCRRRH